MQQLPDWLGDNFFEAVVRLKSQIFANVADTLAETWIHLRGLRTFTPRDKTYDCGDKAYITDCDALGHLNAIRSHSMFDNLNSVMAVAAFPCGCVSMWDVVSGCTFGRCDDHFTGEHAIDTWDILRETEHNEICQHQGMADSKIRHKINLQVNELTRDVKFD